MNHDLKERLECASYAVKEDGDVDDSLLSEALARIQQLEADLEKARAVLTAGEEAEVLREIKSDADLIARLKAIAVDVFPSANEYAVSAGVKNIIRILEHIDPDEYAAIHRAIYPFSYTDNGDGQPTEAQEWQDYDPYC